MVKNQIKKQLIVKVEKLPAGQIDKWTKVKKGNAQTNYIKILNDWDELVSDTEMNKIEIQPERQMIDEIHEDEATKLEILSGNDIFINSGLDKIFSSDGEDPSFD